MTRQALEGLKVLDFCWVIAGPLVGLYLAQHGATVIRVESILRPDVYRTVAPYKDNVKDVNKALSFVGWNSNKYGMALNLGDPRAIGIAKNHLSIVTGRKFKSANVNNIGPQIFSVLSSVAKADTLIFILNDTLNNSFTIVAADERGWLDSSLKSLEPALLVR